MCGQGASAATLRLWARPAESGKVCVPEGAVDGLRGCRRRRARGELQIASSRKAPALTSQGYAHTELHLFSLRNHMGIKTMSQKSEGVPGAAGAALRLCSPALSLRRAPWHPPASDEDAVLRLAGWSQPQPQRTEMEDAPTSNCVPTVPGLGPCRLGSSAR